VSEVTVAKRDRHRNEKAKKPKGRYGYDDYSSSPTSKIEVGQGLSCGQMCPECQKGKIYPATSRKLLQFDGNPPVSAKRFEKEVLRCNTCLKEFSSNERIDRWMPEARSSIVIFKTMGMPFHRMANIQVFFNVPLAESTMWKQIKDMWDESFKFIDERLHKLASECDSFYMDDTRATILEVKEANKKLLVSERRSCNTTVISTSTEEGHQIVLYITSNKHCGENFSELLEIRESPIDNIKVMADASSNNLSKLSSEQLEKIIIFKCNAHSRRKYHELLNYEEAYCMWFLKEIGCIYVNDRFCKKQNYTEEERLEYHQRCSKEHMDNIYAKIDELFEEKLVEPNSALGKAMKYWKNHKEGLTKFLYVAGMSLDNNMVEQLMKYFIMQRKSSYFYKTLASAKILSGFTSIITTCRVNNVNANEYLNWVQENWLKVQASQGSNYMPWDYNEYKKKLEAENLAKLAA